MPETKNTIVGIGEVLWDLLEDGKQLGGAPANFAYITSLLGNSGLVASRVGPDSLGDAALGHLSLRGLSIDYIQTDPVHPTGVVKVELDAAGQPCFQIALSSAWDFLEWTPQWQELAGQADAVCFGSLAQRSAQSRSTIQRFLTATRKDAVRVYDVNLRQTYYSAEVLGDSLLQADIVKLNHEELPKIMALLGLFHRDELSSLQQLVTNFSLKLACLTRGGRGSVLMTDSATVEHTGFGVKVADTIGAGDAFTAGLVHEYLRGSSLDAMNETANRIGAWVASQVGAMPVPEEGGLPGTLAKLG